MTFNQFSLFSPFITNPLASGSEARNLSSIQNSSLTNYLILSGWKKKQRSVFFKPILRVKNVKMTEKQDRKFVFLERKKLGSRGHCVDFISTASRASMPRDMRSAKLKLFCRESSEQDNLQFWTSSNAKYRVRENEVLFADVATTCCCLFAAFHKYLSASEYASNSVSIISLFSARQPINFLKRHRSLCGPLQGLS